MSVQPWVLCDWTADKFFREGAEAGCLQEHVSDPSEMATLQLLAASNISPRRKKEEIPQKTKACPQGSSQSQPGLRGALKDAEMSRRSPDEVHWTGR